MPKTLRITVIARHLVTLPVRFWSNWISPSLAPRCRYEPSCSRYSIQAIEELGILRGLVLTAWRVLRCNPFSHGGVDKVADQRLFRAAKTCPNHQHEMINQL
ncbi:MAG: membrane protein insertion efficiency factor YidD [Actinomycetes bacterium]